MPADNRLSRMLHVLIHMDQREGPVTSEVIARMLGANAVVVRRTMGGLKAAGYLASVKGHGGGWTLTTPLDRITLRDIHEALGSPKVFAIGLAEDDPKCLVEEAVNEALVEALDEAERQLLERFGEVMVGDIAREFACRLAASGGGRTGDTTSP
jgi:DNA-binding IscR family transcriptional regulator